MVRSSSSLAWATTGVLIVSLCLVACGGGGGGSTSTGGGGTSTPDASFTVSPTSVSVTADTSSSAPVYASIVLTVAHAKSDVYLNGRYSINGIFQITAAQESATQYKFTVQFRDAPTLAPGKYSDSLYLKLCADMDCATPITSTTTVAMQYTVTGTAVARPHVTVDSTPIVEQTLFAEPVQQANIALTFDGLDSTRAVDHSTTTNNAIREISFIGAGGSSGVIIVYFKPDLPHGVYHDVVTTSLCNNDTNGCQETIAGSESSVSVTLTVSDTISGPNGYSVRFAPVLANGLAWDAQRQVIYATTRDNTDPNAGSITTFDPRSGVISNIAPLAGGPNRLAVTGDGAYLYVGQDAAGTVSRLVLPAMTSDISIALGVDPSLGATLRATDLEPSPDDSHAVAVAVSLPSAYTPNCKSITLFDDTQVRASLPGNGTDASPCSGSIQWGASSSVLYADDVESFPSDIYQIAVGPTSMSSALLIPGNDFLYDGPIQYRAGLLYTAGGVIYDTTNNTVLGQIPTPTNRLLRGVFSPETHRVITVDDAVSGLDGIRITAFDTTTYSEIAHIDLPHLYVQQNADGTSLNESEAWRAIRWGTDGYALPLTDGRVLIIQGAFVGP